MKATGIVRRVDDLGRIVIPKEIRRNLGLREGEAMEIFLEDNCVCFKKYSPPEEDFAVKCQKYVSDRGVYIKAISFTDGTTVVLFTNGSSARDIIEYALLDYLECLMQFDDLETEGE